MSEPFLGEIRIFGFNFAPVGWAFCQGQLLAIAQNDALFTLLGTTYGGDGQETFALPNLSARAPMHASGSTPIGLGAGQDEVTLTTLQIPFHTHQVIAQTGLRTQASPASGTIVAGDIYGQGTSATFAPGAVQSSGQSQPHSNLQPYLVLNFCIALEGIYPSRG